MPLAPYGRKYMAQRAFQGATGPAAIGTLYLALVTEAVLDADDGTTIAEVPGTTTYTRKAVTLSATNFPIDDNGSGAYVPAVQFPTVGAASWGTIVGFALMTNNTIGSGSVFAYGSVQVNEPEAGDAPIVPAGTLLLSVQD